MSRMHLLRSVVPAVAALGLLAACGGDGSSPATAGTRPSTTSTAPTPPTEVRVTAEDYRFDLPSTVAAGRVRVTLENRGTEPHHAMFVALDEGDTAQAWLDKVIAAKSVHGEGLGHGAGGAPMTDVAASTAVEQDLAPGQYAVVCLLSSPDGTPHLLKGMLGQVEVTGSGDDVPRPPDVDDDDAVVLHEYGFDVPEGWDGERPLEVVNRGAQDHEVVVARLAEGATVHDVVAWERPLFTPFPGPRPYTPVAGTGFLAPGGRSTMLADLAPGDYVMMCFVADAGDGRSHLSHGMARTFTVG